MEEPLDKKVTTPLATGAPPLATVAAKVTESPEVALAEDALSAVAVAAITGTAGATVTRTALEAEAAKLVVPA
jgi:hypothetical protein